MDKILNYIKNNTWEFLAVVLITVLALVLRVVAIMNLGEIWSDELFSWFFASKPSALSVITQATQEDIHMPLYFVILHFWIKIFSNNPNNQIAMRVLSLLLSFSLIPFGFYFSKKLFNKTTAYFALLFLTLNTFCVYYSIEIRFYALVLVLSLISGYYFVQILDNFNKKNCILYILSTSLLFYTFTIMPLLALSYFLAGAFYLILKKRENLVLFLETNAIIIVLCSPAIYWVAENALSMKRSLTYFPIDNYPFNPLIGYDILENLFSSYNRQIINNNHLLFSNMFENLSDFVYLLFVFVPVLIGIFGLIRAVFSKNKNLYLFLLPSLLFLIMLLVFSALHMATIQTRYLAIIFPVLIVSFCYGLSLFKNKIITYSLYFIFIFLNIFGLLFFEKTVFNLHRYEMGALKDMFAFAGEIDIRENDVILMPVLGDELTYYLPKNKGIYIPFNADSAYVLKNTKSAKFYLGDKAQTLTRDTIRDYLIKSVISDTPLKTYEDNLNENYLKNMKKGQRAVLVVFYTNLLYTPEMRNTTYETYKDQNLVAFLYAKACRDSLLVLDKYLKYKKHKDTDYNFTYFIFEKE